MIKKTISILASLLCLLPAAVLAQVNDPQKAYTAFDMRSNGKIYVVVGVVLIILTGLFLYLIRLDRKITRLEKEQ
ncbi:MAG: CcmD family protein [Bacteroidetes bacterium]|nr:CcmD family protein [Bacteroidota bacterium]